MVSSSPTSRAERGSVQYAVLALLSQRARHGYELHGLFQATLAGHWEVNTGQIYSSLERLARDGLVAEASVEKDGGPERRTWALTESGRAELLAWLRSSVPRGYHLRDEFYLKLILAVVTRAERPHHVLQAQRRQLFQELHDLTALRNAANPSRELARILLLDSGIMHTEAELRWLDMVEARLDEIRAQPPAPRPVRRRGRPRKAGGPAHSSTDSVSWSGE